MRPQAVTQRWGVISVRGSARCAQTAVSTSAGSRSPAIHVPTLVIHRLNDRITPPFHGRYLAEQIAGARYFEQPGDHSLRFAGGGDIDALFGEIASFLAGVPPQK